jgi:hypothetical protein
VGSTAQAQQGTVADENSKPKDSEQQGKAIGLNTRSRKPLSNLGTNVQQSQQHHQSQCALPSP